MEVILEVDACFFNEVTSHGYKQESIEGREPQMTQFLLKQTYTS
jgi:hypothetical protein